MDLKTPITVHYKMHKTGNLRWFVPARTGGILCWPPKLQEEWIVEGLGRLEWRDVPIVHQEDEE